MNSGPTLEQVLRDLGVDPEHGLAPEEAARRLARYGPNVLVPGRRWPWWAWVFRPLLDPMVLLLLAAAAAYALVGDHLQAGIMVVATVPVVVLDLVLEGRAEQALEQLRKLVSPRVQVLRGGQRVTLSSEELVPGDIVLLHEGDVAPADGLLLEGGPLHIDESSITGEAQPVSKEAVRSLAGEKWPLAAQHRVMAGTGVLSGRGKMVVIATGASTEYGRIGALVAAIQTGPTPLERSVTQLARRLAPVAAVAIVGVAGLQLFRGAGWTAAISAGVGTAIALIPEEFPVVLALYLALGAWRMATHHALVRRLPAVETLGSATVICTDKTGTLTLGHMALTGLWDGRQVLVHEQLSAEIPLSPASRHLLETAVLASDPDPTDPLDQAIFAFARPRCVDPGLAHQRWALVRVYPFDPQLRRVTYVWQSRTGPGYRVCAKGSIESMLEVCHPPSEQVQAALEANRLLTGSGMRVLAVAERLAERVVGARTADESALSLIGLVAFTDPVRPGVPEAIARCLQAGVRVVMITGDHPLTAHAVAEGIGLPHRDDRIITGPALEQMTVHQLAAVARETNVFARILPAQKYVIVRGFKEAGEIVAMTGDGINDAPALKEADIGIAMGQRGTEVARQAATMVLLDDNFATIVAAIEEGRRIFDNLHHAFRYLIAFHVPIAMGALLVPLIGLPLLFFPPHLVWLELIIHPTVSLVFQADPPAPDLMRRPPRAPRRPLLSAADLALSSAQGLVAFAGLLALYMGSLATGTGEEVARSLALAALVLAQDFLVLSHRSPGRPWWEQGLRANPLLVPMLVLALGTMLPLVYVGPVAQALHLAPLSFAQWLLAAAIAAATTLWLEPVKRVVRPE